MRVCKYEYPNHCAPSRTFVTVPSTTSALRLSARLEMNCDSIGVECVSSAR